MGIRLPPQIYCLQIHCMFTVYDKKGKGNTGSSKTILRVYIRNLYVYN